MRDLRSVEHQTEDLLMALFVLGPCDQLTEDKFRRRMELVGIQTKHQKHTIKNLLKFDYARIEGRRIGMTLIGGFTYMSLRNDFRQMLRKSIAADRAARGSSKEETIIKA